MEEAVEIKNFKEIKCIIIRGEPIKSDFKSKLYRYKIYLYLLNDETVYYLKLHDNTRKYLVEYLKVCENQSIDVNTIVTKIIRLNETEYVFKQDIKNENDIVIDINLSKEYLLDIYRIISLFKLDKKLNISDISTTLLIIPSKVHDICELLRQLNILINIYDETYVYIGDII